MAKLQDITEKRYGRLVAIKVSHKTHSGRYWLCKCDCGNTIKAIINHLNNGHIRSCGCLNREVARETNTKHGMYKTKEYRTWIGMRGRCNNPNNKAFKNYGARGIKVCERWDTSFEAFFADMGKKPFPEATIERIDNNDDYTPENCKWATVDEQLNNTRRNVRITIDSDTKTLFQWLRVYNVKPRTYYARIYQGWSQLDAIQRPVRKHRQYQPSTLEK